MCLQPEALPLLAWHRIVEGLDAWSALQLRRCSTFFCRLVSTAAMTQLSVTDLKDTDVEQLAAECPAASCLCITPPRRLIALSRLNQRRRCEQHLAVFLDNLAPWPTLTALDISTALSHISCTTLQLLAENLPQLHQLSLPPVATCAGTAADALGALQQLHGLCACDLDCSLFRQSSCGSLQDDEPCRQQQEELTDLGEQQQQQHLIILEGPAAQAPPAAETAFVASPQQQPTDFSNNVAQQQQQQVQLALDMQDRQHLDNKLAADPPAGAAHPSSTATATSCYSRSAVTSTNTNTSTSSSSTHSSNSSSSRTCADTASSCSSRQQRPGSWSGLCCLGHIQHLQLQHLQPSCMPDALRAVSRMRGLRSLSIAGLSQASAALVLAPASISDKPARAGSSSALHHRPDPASQLVWLLDALQELPRLSRLELGMEASTAAACSRFGGSSSSNSSSHSSCHASSLVVPGHTGIPAGHPAAPAAALRCSWSNLQQLQELVLHRICLDSVLFAATLTCQQLTALEVGGLDLQQDVQAVLGGAPNTSCMQGLASLRVLCVEQHWDLGPNTAAMLMPQLQSLALAHAGSCRPDLSCLEHHQHLSSLDIAAPAEAGWALHDLQLGYLVHLEPLCELRLQDDSSCAGSGHCGNGAMHCSSGSRSSPTRHAVGRTGAGCKGGSHWLPCYTGHLQRVTSLELCGPVPDHALGQVVGQFPGLKRLTIDSSYFASDGGLQKLGCAPQLQLLVLRNCQHITDYGLEVLMMGGGMKVVAVQGCAGIDERACHRIHKACRYGGAQLLWYGCDTGTTGSAGTSCSSPYTAGALHSRGLHAEKPRHTPVRSGLHGSAHCGGGSSISSGSALGGGRSSPALSPNSAGSAFLQRCWREEQQQQQQASPTMQCSCAQQPHRPGSTAALVAAASQVWLDVCLQEAATVRQPHHPPVTRCRSAHTHAAGAGAYRAAAAAAGTAVGGDAVPVRARRVSGSCVPPLGAQPGASRGQWARDLWGAGRTVAH